MTTPPRLLSPAELAVPPHLEDDRPHCSCGALPAPGYVGVHGNGLTHRRVLWPQVDSQGGLALICVKVVGRRYRCPACARTVRVSHAGLRHGATYGIAVIVALLHVITTAPRLTEADAHSLARGQRLPVSERARSGHPRWSTLRRWIRDLDRLWPNRALPGPHRGRQVRVNALLASFGVGAPLSEVLDAAIDAHGTGGAAM